jgi:hypothetical protein
MDKTQFKGKKYANLLRCSTKDQDMSIDDQRSVNNHYAHLLGMVHSHDVEAEGVSGSKTFCRGDIEQLIDSKHDGADFEIVVVHDFSRLTRGGIAHGHEVKQRLAALGVSVLSATEDFADGDEGELLESVTHYKNKVTSKNNAGAITRTRRACLEQALHPSASTNPFGFDRLYVGPDDKPTLLMRILSDGRKVKLDPNTLEVRGYIDKDENGKSVKFLKQSDERSRLVLGEPDKAELVRWMFREYWVNGKGYSKITNILNQGSIRPHRAKVIVYRPTTPFGGGCADELRWRWRRSRVNSCC